MGKVYETIYDLCKKKGITAAQMCREAGVSPNTMTELKSGRHTGLSAKKANKIAAYFGVSVGYLLGEEEKEKATAQVGDLTEEEMKLIMAYRNSPEVIKTAVDGLLDPYKAANPSASLTAG